MNRFESPELIISRIQHHNRIAVTAPLVVNERVLIGIALSGEEVYSVALSLNELPDLFVRFSTVVKMTTVVFHGLKAIWEFLDEIGLESARKALRRLNVSQIDDTRLMAYQIDPDCSAEINYGDYRVQERLNLASLAQRYLGVDYPYRMTDISGGVSLETAGNILAYDAGLIFQLAEKLPSLMSADLIRLYRNVELPLMAVLDDMRRVGMGFDGVRCAEMVVETQRTMAQLAHEITGGATVDLTSTEDVYRFLLEKGAPLPATAPRPGTNDLRICLEEIAHTNPLAGKIIAWWDMGRDLGFLRRWSGKNRIHPVWGQTRAATSRIYARRPAVQNISRELRHLLIPSPGHVLVKADYTQAQMRIIAHLSRDLTLRKIFQDPEGDVHRETSDALGLNDRSVAKEINFAICFGMGATALCNKINELKRHHGVEGFIDEKTARCYIEAFYERFPKVRDFFAEEWEKIKKLPPKERVVKSLAGRERRFTRRPTAEMERQFRVTWTQQIEADLIKTFIVRLDRILGRRGLKASIVMMIHDALWVECPLDEETEVRRLMRRMMTTAGRLDVPLDVDFK